MGVTKVNRHSQTTIAERICDVANLREREVIACEVEGDREAVRGLSAAVSMRHGSLGTPDGTYDPRPLASVQTGHRQVPRPSKPLGSCMQNAVIDCKMTSCQYRLRYATFLGRFVMNLRLERRSSGARCRNSCSPNWSESRLGLPAAPCCNEFESASKAGGVASRPSGYCVPVTRIGSEGRH